MGDHGEHCLMRGVAQSVRAISILCLCAFINIPAAHAQDARIEKEYKGTLTGAIQPHPGNVKYPYWLKCNTSTYGIVLGDDAKAKALLEEFIGTRISLTGMVQEFADGGLAIMPELPITRPAENPGLALVRKAMADEATRQECDYTYIEEETLLGNGEDLFLVAFYSRILSEWYSILYSVKNGGCTALQETSDSATNAFGHWPDWSIVSMDNDVLTISAPRNRTGRGLMETWTYENGKLSEHHDILTEVKREHQGEKHFNGTISGFVLANDHVDKYFIKSNHSLYLIYSIDKPDFSNNQYTWFNQHIGKWIILTGLINDEDDRPEITPEPPIQGEQPKPAVTITDKSVLFNGETIFTDPKVIYLYLREELVTASEEDVFLINVSGTPACPYLFKIFSVRNGVCAVTDVFGNGDGRPLVSPVGADAVSITFPRHSPGRGNTETWTYKNGAVIKAEATSRP